MLYINKKVVYQLCIFWQWVLMMQLAEFLIWSDDACGLLNYTGTKMALFFNLTQPIVLFFVFFFLSDKPKIIQITSIIVILGYIGFFFNLLNTSKEYTCTKKSENCSALNLAWWENKHSALVYFVTMYLVVFLLSDNSPSIKLCIIYSTITVIISQYLYACGTPSMWCWLVVPFPLVLGLYN